MSPWDSSWFLGTRQCRWEKVNTFLRLEGVQNTTIPTFRVALLSHWKASVHCAVLDAPGLQQAGGGEEGAATLCSSGHFKCDKKQFSSEGVLKTEAGRGKLVPFFAILEESY